MVASRSTVENRELCESACMVCIGSTVGNRELWKMRVWCLVEVR